MNKLSNQSNVLTGSLKKIIKIIDELNNLIIVTHTNPDGDAIGSSLALHRYLKSKGKKSTVLVDSPVPQYLNFLFEEGEIEVFNKVKHFNLFLSVEAFFVLDLNDPARLRSLERQVLDSPAAKILIDHHINPKQFADLAIIDDSAASTAQLIWKLIKTDSTVEPNKEIAEAVYVGIMTDTGGFRHNRTDAEIFRIAAKLIDLGADPVDLYDRVYNQNSIEVTKLLGDSLRNLELHYNGKMSVMALSEEALKSSQVRNEDLEGFVEKTLSVAGVKVGVLLSKMPESDDVKISFRSKEDFNVRKLAALFGGGGHLNASGATMRNSHLQKAKHQIIKEAEFLFKNGK